MKTICLVLTFALAGAVAAEERPWRRGAYMEKYLAATPWESKALTPVKLVRQPSRGPIVLCERAKPVLPIVVPARNKPGSGYYRQVAEFLKTHLDAATGGSFEVVGDDSAPSRGIFVGPCDATEAAPFRERARTLDPEHFLVGVFSGGVILIGRDISDVPGRPDTNLNMNNRRQSRGTLFAGADFLERFIGVRFYMPGELGTCIPFLNNRTVTIPSVEYTDGPVFETRLSSYGNYLTKDHALLNYTKREGTAWMIALRNADYYALKSGHTDGHWHEFYAEKHPDWFALREDRSRMIGRRGELSSQRCYTNEDAFQEHLHVIGQFYENGKGRELFAGCPPNDKYIYWWPNDGFKGCHCDDCQALIDTDAPKGSRYARLIWGYAAKLGRAVKQSWPDKTLVVSFYSSWSDGPGDLELPDNITFMIVETREAYLKEPVYWEQVTRDLQAKMALAGAPVALWSHYPHRPRIHNRTDAPYLVPHFLQEYVRWLRGKSSGVYLNGHYTASFALDGVAIYLYKKLLWNPDLDVDALLDEYCRVMFGPAGSEIAVYYRTIINGWEKTRWQNLTDQELRDPHAMIKWPRYFQEAYPRNVRLKLESLLAGARSRVKPGTVYDARTRWLIEGVQPFFRQGELLDRGAVVSGECNRLTPTIDGRLDEWPASEPLLLRNNTNNAEVSVETEIRTAHDAERFYLAVNAREPDGIRAAAPGQRRDSQLWRHDSVEIFLCTEQPGMREAGLGITDRYHQFILDPNGNLYDSYRSIGAKGADARVDVDFEHATRRTPDGFVIEMAIPYASINAVPPRPGDHWFVNFYRNRKRKEVPGEVLHSWSPTLASAHDTSRFGRLDFPTETVWEADFSSFDENWRIGVPRDDIQVTHTVRDGRTVLHVCSDKLDAKENQGKSTEINISFKPKRQPYILSLDDPVNFQWRFRFQGPGMLRIRAHTGSKGNEQRLSHQLLRPEGYEDAGWTVGVGDKPDDGKEEPPNLAYCFFALKVLPNADFTFEVDYIKVVQRP